MLEREVLRNHRDTVLARRLAEAFGREGWSVDWVRIEDGRWSARVACPSPALVVDFEGSSRVASISGAHVEAIRRLGLDHRKAVVPPASVRVETTNST